MYFVTKFLRALLMFLTYKACCTCETNTVTMNFATIFVSALLKLLKYTAFCSGEGTKFMDEFCYNMFKWTSDVSQILSMLHMRKY